jgi:hypothetical protein
VAEDEYIVIALPLESDILDPIKATERLVEQTVNHQGRWRIHKNDPDDRFPSDPHADRIDEPSEKLNLYTGDVFDRSTKKCLYTLSNRSMVFIYNKILKKGEENIIAKLNANKQLFTYL